MPVLSMSFLCLAVRREGDVVVARSHRQPLVLLLNKHKCSFETYIQLNKLINRSQNILMPRNILKRTGSIFLDPARALAPHPKFFCIGSACLPGQTVLPPFPHTNRQISRTPLPLLRISTHGAKHHRLLNRFVVSVSTHLIIAHFYVGHLGRTLPVSGVY